MFKSFFLCLFIIFSFQCFSTNYTLYSPDKNILVTVSVTDKVSWSLSYKNEVMLQPGNMSMAFDNGVVIGDRPTILKEKRRKIDDMITSVVPVKSKLIKEQYNEITFSFKGN